MAITLENLFRPAIPEAQMQVTAQPQTLAGGVPMATTTATPVAPLDNTLPAPNPLTINGANYVATATPAQAGAGFSPANVLAGLNQQLGMVNQPSAIEAVQGIANAFALPTRPSATDTTMGALEQLLSSGGSYIRNAQRRGLETAGARGLMNSSIASGAAERAAIESSMPILNQIMNLQGQREQQDWQANQANRAAAMGLTEQQRTQDFQRTQNLVNQAADLTRQRESQAFQAQESQLGRTQQVNMAMLDAQLRSTMMEDEALKQDWLNSRDFTRQFNGQLSMLPIRSAIDMTTAISQFAMQDPELYTPTIVSGMSEFFNKNMLAIMQQYFPTTQGGS